MDGRGNTYDERNRLAKVERQLAELRAEVQELRREIQRLGGGTREQPSDEMQEESPGDVPDIVITVLVSADRPSQGEQVSPAPSGLAEEPPGVQITDLPLRSTVVVHAPAELLRGWDGDRPAPALLKEQADCLLDEVGERLAEQATETGLNPVWDVATTSWHVTDLGGFERVAGRFGDLDNWGHQAVATWVKDVGRAIGMPGDVAFGVGGVIGLAIPLPIDGPLVDASRVIQVAGVVFAAATGNMPLACASLKVFAHDQLIDFVAKGILNVVPGLGEDRTSPEQEPDLEPGRPGATELDVLERDPQSVLPGQEPDWALDRFKMTELDVLERGPQSDLPEQEPDWALDPFEATERDEPELEP